MTATDTPMVDAKGPDYVAHWVEHMQTRTGASWPTVRSAVAAAHIQHGHDILSNDVTLDVIGQMTPSIAKTAAARIAEYARMADETHQAGHTPTRTCQVCGGRATMAANLGPSCAQHYDTLS